MERTITRFKVPGISCGHCKAAIEGAVSPAAGVRSAVVDIEDRRVTVAHDPEVTSVAEVIGLIEDQGYDIEAFEEVVPR